MRERLEATDHVRYLEVKVDGHGQPLTYHTYDWSLDEGDPIEVCGGQLQGCKGYVRAVENAPPMNYCSQPIYTYRVKRDEPRPVAILMSDGTRRPI